MVGSTALIRTFRITDAVEGAVEVRFELAEALKEYRPRLGTILAILVLAILLTLGVLGVEVYSSLGVAWDAYEGERDLSLLEVVALGMDAILLVLVLALAASLLLFLFQVRKFVQLLQARYGTLEASPRVETSEAGMRREGIPKDAELHRNPLGMLFGLAREAEEGMPQIDSLVRYSTVFTFLLAGLLSVEISIALAGYTPLPVHWIWVIGGVQGLALILIVVSIPLMLEMQRFLEYFRARVEALEAFEEQPPLFVPEGATALDRFISCLLYTGKAHGPVHGPCSLGGSLGEQAFDQVLGDRGDRVIVRVFHGVPSEKELRSLRTAAEDVARREGALPKRIVALIDAELDDLDIDDDTYEFLMGSPILDEMGERGRSVQIVAEVEGHYSVLPFTYP